MIPDFFRILTQQEQQERLDVCDSCEHKINVANLCGKCGCFLPAKVTLAAASCPEMYWTNKLDQD